MRRITTWATKATPLVLSRANVLRDPRLGQSGRRKVENPKHITGMHWANYMGKLGAGMYLSPSKATDAEDRRIRAYVVDRWLSTPARNLRLWCAYGGLAERCRDTQG